ncbi:hypothetical protein WA588_005769 [Blastocystis sp. NMH]
MLYYKFLKDKKGALTQVCLAAQSPNKVSKRVILDVSIPSCADTIADSTTDLPLQMRALLLLGLSHILGKKAQLLLNDCYRIQSALGDVMSLTSNDLPKELVVASDQQITLNSGMARASHDVDISFDQGEANFAGDQLVSESLSGSLNVSLNQQDELLDVETDMLQRYTQESILDELLPAQPEQSLMAQEMEVETRRGAASGFDSTMLLPGLAPENAVAPIARLEDSWDGAMDMDVEPLSGGDSVADATMQTTLLKPQEKTVRRGQRKRPALRLDKSLELPMAGVVTTRQKLREALQNARAKRQRLNELRIVLLDTMNEEGDRYGVCLQKLLTSRLLSGQTETKSRPLAQEELQNMDDEMPEMDIEPISVGEDVPASSEMLPPNEPEAVQPTSEAVEREAVEEAMNYDSFMSDIREKIDDALLKDGKKGVSWDTYTAYNTRHTAAANFFHLLVAASKEQLEVSQKESYGDILVSVM